jgi:hypothetical protein
VRVLNPAVLSRAAVKTLHSRFVQEAAEGSYDVIIVDSSDPVGPAEVLFQQVCSSAVPCPANQSCLTDLAKHGPKPDSTRVPCAAAVF